MPAAPKARLLVTIPASFGPYVDAALVRLRTLHPGLRFLRRKEAIAIESEGRGLEAGIEADVLHAVYREKIYAESLEMRRSLVAAMTR